MPVKIDDEYVADNLPAIDISANKSDCGKLGVIAGSYGMAGAAALCINAAYRSGAGLVYGYVPESIYGIVATLCPNAVFIPYGDNTNIPLRSHDAIAIGCGMGNNEKTKQAVLSVIGKNIPFVLDADGINSVADSIQILKGSNAVITPHSAEAARVLGCTPKDVESDRIGTVKKLNEISGAVAVLKGHNTLICDGEDIFVCEKGNNGMATAGSGDLLTGIIGTFLSQGLSPTVAANMGVYIHAFAGDIAAEKLSRRAMCSTDIIDTLPEAFSHFER